MSIRNVVRQSALMIVVHWFVMIGAYAQAPPTSQEVFMEHSIPFTTDGIEGALTNSDPDVRGIAAGVLAERKSIRSIPAIEYALERERVPHVRISFATALAQLQNHAGDTVLINMCTDSSSSAIDRLTAANRLLSLGDDSCIMSIVNLLKNDVDDPPTRSLTLEYFRKVANPPPSLGPRVRKYLYIVLRDPAPINRQYAGDCLSLYGNKSSKAVLAQAIAREQDQPTKAHLVENLKQLQMRLR